MAVLTVDFRKHSGPTPADEMAAQIITDCGNFTLDFKQHGFCASPLFLQTLGPFIWKEDFGPLCNSPVLLLLSPGKILLTMFLFQKWLGSPFPEYVWAWWLLMHWWLQLQFTPCEALPSVWIGVAWQYSQACGHSCCLYTFPYPMSSFQSTFHLICFDTALLEQTPFSNDPLWLTLFVEGVNDQRTRRTRDTQNSYCMNGHLQLKCKYSNILRYWVLTFISCKL